MQQDSAITGLGIQKISDNTQLLSQKLEPTYDDTSFVLSLANDGHQSEENPVLIQSYIDKILLKENTSQNGLIFKFYNIFEKVFPYVGLLAGIPYVKTAFSGAGNNAFLGYAFVAGTITSYGFTTTWVLKKAVKRFKPLDKDEALIIDKKSKYIKLIASNVLGVTASIPMGYTAYKYNDSVLLGLIAFFNAFNYESLGFAQLFSNESPFHPLFNTIGKCLFRNKKQVKQARQALIKLIRNELIPIILKEPQLDDSNPSSKIFIKDLLGLRKKQPQSKQGRKLLYKLTRSIFTILPIAFPIGYLATDITLSHQAAKALIPNEALAIFFTPFTVVPNFMLNSVAATNLGADLFDTLYSICTRDNYKNYLSLNHFYLDLLLKFACLLSAFLAASSDTFVTYDTLGETFLSNWRILFTIITLVSTIMFQGFANYDVISEMFTNFIALINTRAKKQIDKIYRLEKIALLLENSKIDVFEPFKEKVLDEVEQQISDISGSYGEGDIEMLADVSPITEVYKDIEKKSAPQIEDDESGTAQKLYDSCSLTVPHHQNKYNLFSKKANSVTTNELTPVLSPRFAK